MTPIPIGIAGFARAGKSTFAKRLQSALAGQHLGSEVVPFAGPLKNGLSVMGIEKDVDPDLYRLAAQQLGTNVVRANRPDHWVDLFRRYVSDSPRTLSVQTSAAHGTRVTYRDIVIADDVRFENEVAAIKSLGGIMVYVDSADRLGLTKRRPFGCGYRLKRSGIWRHESEDLAASWWKDARWFSDVWVNGNKSFDGDEKQWADAWIKSGIEAVKLEVYKVLESRRVSDGRS